MATVHKRESFPISPNPHHEPKRLHFPTPEELGFSKDALKFIAPIVLSLLAALGIAGKAVADHNARSGEFPQNPQVPTQYDPKMPY